MDELLSIDNRIHNCSLCTGLVDKFPNSPTLYLGKDNDILLIGEAPANNGWRKSGLLWRDTTGKMLPSGVVLQKLFDVIDRQVLDTSFLEAVKCYPLERKNLKICSNNCKQYMLEQIKIINPKIIITLGEFPTRTLLNFKFKKFSDVVGLSTRLRLKLSKSYTFSLNATWATYAYEFNDKGQVIVGNRTEWSYGRFGRFQGMSQNISYTFNNSTLGKIKKLFGADDDENELMDDDLEDKSTEDMAEDMSGVKLRKKKSKKADVDDEGYMPFKLPWNFTVSYGIVMAEDRSAQINIKNMRYPYKFTQNMNFSGNIGISDNWKINFTSGYNFEFKRLTTTTMNISRDLHCFEMSCGIVLSPYTSFNFSFRATSQMLADALKVDKRSSGSSNVDWY